MAGEKLFQEMPPKGGYPERVQWKRNLPARGFRPITYLFLVGGICGYGFYRAISGIRERNELYREKLWSRFHIQPLLLAESDRDLYRRVASLRAKEQEVMSDVPDFDANESVYHDKAFRAPEVVGFPKF